MSKAGGILGMIAGIFGFVAAIVTLSLGGIGAAFNADKANTIFGLGYGGTNEAMFAVNTVTGKYYALLFTDGKKFNVFGVASMRELTAPLLQWFQNKGGKL